MRSKAAGSLVAKIILFNTMTTRFTITNLNCISLDDHNSNARNLFNILEIVSQGSPDVMSNVTNDFSYCWSMKSKIVMLCSHT